MADKVTIRTIAELCDVSPTTVSLVLNNKPGVADETRARVIETSQKLGYKTTGSSHGQDKRLISVGILVKTEAGLLPPSNPFYSQVIAGVDDACREMGISLLFSMLPVDADNYPIDVPPLVSEGAVDGLLLVGAFIDRTISTLFGAQTPPIVLVDGYSDTCSYDMVVSDNFGGAYKAVEHLIELGHRQIGLVGSYPGCYPSIAERRNGYLRALKDQQIPDTYIANFNINRSQGEQETLALLRENPQLTALFCVNDNVALGALRAAQELGRRVPQDLSIVGYDDTYLATSISPALTTMQVDTLAMGRAAVHMLALRIEKPDAAQFTLTIHPRLITRASSAARW